MKVGDKVRVLDGSYSLAVKASQLEPNYGIYLQNYGVHTIFAMDCDLPAASAHERNNTVIVADSNGIVTFIQRKYLTPDVKYCSRCGQIMPSK